MDRFKYYHKPWQEEVDIQYLIDGFRMTKNIGILLKGSKFPRTFWKSRRSVSSTKWWFKEDHNSGTLMVPETSQEGGFRNMTNQIILKSMSLTLARGL